MSIDSFKNREEYVSSIKEYLNKLKEDSENERHSFFKGINEETWNYYHNKYCKMIGIDSRPNNQNASLISKEKILIKDNVDVYRYCFNYHGIKCFGLLFKYGDFSNTPFAICLHGGGGTPEIVSSIDNSENYNDYVQRIIKRGVNVFCPQLLLWNKEKIKPDNYDRHDIDSKLKQLGSSITALEMQEITSILNYFIKKEKINKDMIGVAGMSYGGMYAMFLGAYDKRYKAVLSSCFFNDRFEHSWVDWSYFNSQLLFTDAEIASLIYPRKLYVSVADHDCMFKVDAAKSQYEIIKDLYFGDKVNKSFKLSIFDGDHEFDKSDEDIELFCKDIGTE